MEHPGQRWRGGGHVTAPGPTRRELLDAGKTEASEVASRGGPGLVIYSQSPFSIKALAPLSLYGIAYY